MRTLLSGAGVRRRRALLFIVIGVLGSLVAIASYAIPLAHGVEDSTLDMRFSIRGESPAPNTAVVLIDDRTFNHPQIRQRFPFPRTLHARIIDALRRAGAKQIVYDVQFTEPSGSPAADTALIAAADRAPHIVLATTEVDARGRTRIFGGDAVLRQIGARPGNATYAFEAGTIRRIRYQEARLETLAVAAVLASGEEIQRADFPDGRAWIDYRGDAGTIPSYSFGDVLDDEVPPEAFRGRFVVVGASAVSLQDLHETPTDDLMPGPEVQANAIETILDGNPLRSTPVVVDLALIFALSMLAALLNLRFGPLTAVGISLAAGVVYLGTAQLAFQLDRIVPVFYPLLGLALTGVGGLAASYLLTAFDRQRARDTFARFVPEPVVERVLARTDEDLRLGGEEREVTVLFSDIRGFTTFSETRSPEEVISILNRYLEEMSDAIMDAGGTLVSYIGDGIMAVFGAPLEQPDHADRALAAATEMLGERLTRFNRAMAAEGVGETFRMGIGLNSGPVMVGQVGSRRRLDYTAIGDTVNTAARLEGMTKGTEFQAFVADSTRERLGDRRDELVFVDEMEVRGRSQALRVWALPDEAI